MEKNSQYAFFWAQMIRNKMKWTLQGAYRATAACDVSAVPLIIQQFYWKVNRRSFTRVRAIITRKPCAKCQMQANRRQYMTSTLTSRHRHRPIYLPAIHFSCQADNTLYYYMHSLRATANQLGCEWNSHNDNIINIGKGLVSTTNRKWSLARTIAVSEWQGTGSAGLGQRP